MRPGVDMIPACRHARKVRPSSWMLLLVAALAIAGCGDDREVVFSTDAPAPADDRPALLADIALLAHGKKIADPSHAAPFHQAVDALIGRGARIEPTLIETLSGNDDWGVRLGVVEVLKAVGTRRSIEPLMGALEDPQPLVAFNADRLLREMLSYSVIPASGEPPRDGLPPVPTRPANDLALDAEEKLWAAWHSQHHAALHKAWRAWWGTNKATVKIN